MKKSRDDKLRKLEEKLCEYSDGSVDLERYNDETVYVKFDLKIDDSENNWGELQPKLSVISYNPKSKSIESFNIRLGEIKSSERDKVLNKFEDMFIFSRPIPHPNVEFTTGHTDEYIPHIRMSDGICSVKSFTEFLERYLSRIQNLENRTDIEN